MLRKERLKKGLFMTEEDIRAIQAIQDRSDFLLRYDQFLREIDPIAKERMKLYVMFDSLILFPDGFVEYHYPEAVKKLDDQYVDLIKALQKHIFAENE